MILLQVEVVKFAVEILLAPQYTAARIWNVSR